MEELSMELLQLALSASYDGIVIFNKETRIVYANDKALELNGLTREQALGKTWKELEETGHFHGNAALEALRTRSPCSSEFVNQLGYHLLSTSTPILDGNGEVSFCISNLRDMSRLAELQRKLADRKEQLTKLRSKLNELQSHREKKFIYASLPLRKLISTLDRIAPTDVSVLLLGESGVGKSAVAERIHSRSTRSSGPLLVVNCGAIPVSLCEAEFFGYERGAFTGADRARPGIFESADNGTLVLDEIGELAPDIQVKLLRVLQNGKVKRLGSQKEISVNIRLIAATNQNLKKMVASGKFREDLYYRINIVNFTIAPLRERPDDVKQLITYFLDYYNAKYGVHKTMSPKLVAELEHYSWPGNTREMAHLIERMVVLSQSDVIDCEYLPDNVGTNSGNGQTVIVPLKEAVEETERKLLMAARKQFGNTRNMAKALRVSHATVARKLKEYGIRKTPG